MYYALKCVYVENGLKETTRIRDVTCAAENSNWFRRERVQTICKKKRAYLRKSDV